MVNHHIRRRFRLGLLLCLAAMPALAQAAAWPSPPQLQAKAWAMLDARSGQFVAEHDADMELPPASLTKMMTLYLAFEAIKAGRLGLDERADVSEKAWKIGGSTMFLDPRMHPTVEELLHGVATLSGNDASIVLAEHIAGTEAAFVERMNKKARALGMEHTHFVNATGFPAPGHYSSARDMALLGAALWRDFPEMYKIFSEKSYTYDGRTQPNRNRLLWILPEADGIKTGHTEEAGYCLVASAERGDTRFVTAVFGADSDRARVRQSKLLLQFGFRNFITLRPAERDIRRKVEVYGGAEDEVWLRPAEPVWVTVPKGSESRLAFRLHYQAPLWAPLADGQRIGTIDAVFGDETGAHKILRSVPVITARGVAQASWLARQWDKLRLWWQGDAASGR